jgi:nucleoside-diphosphate-sugar epimerase
LKKKDKIKILLVGASGFIGKNVYKQLNQKYNFVFLVRSKKPEFANNQQFIYNNLDELKNEKIEMIINCAVSYSEEKVSSLIESNILLPIKLIDMFENSIKLFITFDSFYTKFDNNPMLNYSNSKNSIREWYKKFSHLKIINLKLEHVYGRYDSKKKFIPWLIDNMIKNKTIKLSECKQKRDFIHVDEIIKLINEVIIKRDKFNIGYTEMEVGTGKSIEIKKFVLSLLEITKSTSKIFFGQKQFKGEIQDSYSDFNTIPEFIEWKPEISLKKSLNKTLNK